MAVCLASPLFASRSASANPRPLPFTYPWETLGEGSLEIESYTDITPIRAMDGATTQVVEPHYELQTEFEYGITDWLELGLYLVAKNEPEVAGAGAPLFFDGIKQRLRYRIGDEGQLPLDTSVYFEVSELHDEIELEQKLNLQKRFGALKVMANLWVEEAFERGGDVELELHPTAGVTYQFTPHLWAGAEYWMTAKIPLTEDEGEALPPGPEATAHDFDEKAHHFVGPALSVVWDKLWWSVGGYARLDGFGKGMEVGQGLGKLYVRSVIGLSF